MNTSKFRHLTLSALAGAMLAVSAWIALPFGPVCFTLQTLVLFLAAGLLSASEAFSALFVYLSIGLCGIPVFSGFSGGIGVFLSPSGGFLLGFPLALLLCRLIIRPADASPLRLFSGMFIGLAADYLVGFLYYFFLFANGNAAAIPAALSATVLPFIPTDLLKILLAVFLVRRLRPVIGKLR